MVRSERVTSLFHVRLFGGPLLLQEEEVVPLSAYQSALLSVVFGSEVRGLTRLDLTRLLWSDGDEKARRRRLSQLLYSLSHKVSSGPITAKGEQIRPNVEIATSDLVEYQDALREGKVAEAAELMERGFLANLPEEVTESFGDWMEAKRLRFRRELRERASALWSAARREARWPLALEAAQALLHIDPLDEEALRKVVLGRAMLGRLAEARAARQAFEERFRLELGKWAPGSETRALLDRIEMISGEGQDPPSDDGEPLSEPPFCGRERELAALSRALAVQAEDGLFLVTVRGEGGMGKTRLIEEALKGTRIQGIQVLSARSSEFERDIPLNPILEALSRPDVGNVIRNLEDPWRRVLLSLMPELHEGPGPLPEIPHVQPGSLPRRLFEAIRQIFLAVAEQGPVILFLDDFHWADDTSIAALEYLRRRWEGGGLRIVLAVRPEDLERGGAAARFVDALEALHEAKHIELGDLSGEAVRALIDEVGDERVTKGQMERIAALSGRSPFFVIELTLEVIAGREIPVSDAVEFTPIPISIRQLLSHRLAGLSERAELLLSLLVTFGRPLPDDDLRRLFPVSAQGLVDGLEELLQLRLVERAGVSGIRVRHELIRQTVYGRLSEARRSFIHDRIAHFLVRSRDPLPIDELALHFDRAGAKNEAFEFAIKAANAAEGSGAISEALHFLGVARRNTDDSSASTTILWRLGHLNYLHRNLSEAGPLLELAASRLRAQDCPSQAFEAEAEKLDTLASLGALPEKDILREIHQLRDAAKETQNWGIVSTVMDTAVHIHHRANDPEAVRKCLEEIESFLNRGDHEAQCLMRSSLFTHVYYGIPKKGILFSKEAVEMAERLERRDLWLKVVNRYLVATTVQGIFNIQNCIPLIRHAQEIAKVSGDLISRCRLHSNLGVWNIDEGQYDSALQELSYASEMLKDTEAPHLKVNLFYNLGEAHYLIRNIAESHFYFAKAEEEFGHALPGYYAQLIQSGLGLCELYNGNLSAASKIEQGLNIKEIDWNYDPSLYVTFKRHMLAKRGKHVEAIELIERYISALQYRFPIQALRLKIDLARLISTSMDDADRVRSLVKDVVEVATQRRLKILAEEAERVLR